MDRKNFKQYTFLKEDVTDTEKEDKTHFVEFSWSI